MSEQARPPLRSSRSAISSSAPQAASTITRCGRGRSGQYPSCRKARLSYRCYPSFGDHPPPLCEELHPDETLLRAYVQKGVRQWHSPLVRNARDQSAVWPLHVLPAGEQTVFRRARTVTWQKLLQTHRTAELSLPTRTLLTDKRQAECAAGWALYLLYQSSLRD